MDTLTKIVINKKKYYLSDDLLKLNLFELQDCTNGRRIIEKKNMAKKDYIFAKRMGKKWIKSRGTSYKIDRVLISKEWTEENLNEEGDSEEECEECEESEEFSNCEETEYNEAEDDVENKSTKKIIPMPGLIELKKSEKMKDNEGKIVEIEIRGTREYNNCFFLVKDVAKGFGMGRLQDTLLKKNNCGYKDGLHYRYFWKNPTINGKNQKSKNKKSKKIISHLHGPPQSIIFLQE